MVKGLLCVTHLTLQARIPKEPPKDEVLTLRHVAVPSRQEELLRAALIEIEEYKEQLKTRSESFEQAEARFNENERKIQENHVDGLAPDQYGKSVVSFGANTQTESFDDSKPGLERNAMGATAVLDNAALDVAPRTDNIDQATGNRDFWLLLESSVLKQQKSLVDRRNFLERRVQELEAAHAQKDQEISAHSSKLNLFVREHEAQWRSMEADRLQLKTALLAALEDNERISEERGRLEEEMRSFQGLLQQNTCFERLGSPEGEWGGTEMKCIHSSLIKQLQSELDSREFELTEIKTELSRLREDLATARIVGREQSTDQVKEGHPTNPSNYHGHSEAVQTEFGPVEGEMGISNLSSNHKHAFQTLWDKKESYKREAVVARERLTALEREIRRLNTSEEAKDKYQSDLLAHIERLESEMSSLRRDLGVYASDSTARLLPRIEGKLEKYRRKVTSLLADERVLREHNLSLARELFGARCAAQAAENKVLDLAFQKKYMTVLIKQMKAK
ncbi:hypothetical protein M427DRAFT_26727 [Gonapodya prolifera JEL478]|uniref:Uncharacterized protein n=1 Tax=Gonapodya prolifera (strain JEL478) TaxID=1344416 RepID=A0A139AZC7_GONPJ|nr:hypothetical protein M427DRAFT_26727 [Gonapodya prolifera JEL478]|eukprot:KXS22067.1 hypothetical protein M427DRAFT_26727 [Gonapodya prolifera JEL478]